MEASELVVLFPTWLSSPVAVASRERQEQQKRQIWSGEQRTKVEAWLKAEPRGRQFVRQFVRSFAFHFLVQRIEHRKRGT